MVDNPTISMKPKEYEWLDQRIWNYLMNNGGITNILHECDGALCYDVDGMTVCLKCGKTWKPIKEIKHGKVNERFVINTCENGHEFESKHAKRICPYCKANIVEWRHSSRKVDGKIVRTKWIVGRDKKLAKKVLEQLKEKLIK